MAVFLENMDVTLGIDHQLVIRIKVPASLYSPFIVTKILGSIIYVCEK